MRILSNNPDGLIADSSFLYSNPVVTLPSYAHTSPYADEDSAQGSGIGKPGKALYSSIGEALERKHFFSGIRSRGRIRFLEKIPDAEKEAFEGFFRQLSSREDFAEHLFDTAGFVSLRDGSPRLLPSILLDLSGKNGEDLAFVPMRDSVANAGHRSLERSVSASLMEYVERQALVSSWLHKRPGRVLTGVEALGSGQAFHVHEYLSSIGSVTLYDISLGLIPGFVTLAVFTSRADDQLVRFSIGCSGGLSLAQSAEGALSELWLSYQSVKLHELSKGNEKAEEVKELYLREFYKLNLRASAGLYGYIGDAKKSHRISGSDKSVTLQEVIAGILELTPHFYLYSDCVPIEGVGAHYFTKVFSPDLYLHMNTAQVLNHENAITRKLGLGLPSEKRLIPFP